MSLLCGLFGDYDCGDIEYNEYNPILTANHLYFKEFYFIGGSKN